MLAQCTHRTVKVLTGETRKLTKASAAIAAQRPEEIEISGAKGEGSFGRKRCGLCR